MDALSIIYLKWTNSNNKPYAPDLINTSGPETLNSYNVNTSKDIKHFAPAIKEWSDSTYAYNQITTNILPTAHKETMKLIKSYINLFSNKLEYNIRYTSISKKKRRFSSHKIYISKGEFKHTNDKIIIDLYIYDRQKRNYLSKLKKLEKLNRKPWLRYKTIKMLKLKKKVFMKKIKDKKKEIFLLKCSEIEKKIQWDIMIGYIKSKHFNMIYTKSIFKFIKVQMLTFFYKRLNLLNELRFKYIYLNKLTNLIKKIYNKNIEFNIIDLKYFYLNSDIFTESITNKITKNRKRLYRILKKSIEKVKLSNKNWTESSNKITVKNRLSIFNFVKNNDIKSFLYNPNNKDNVSNLLYKILNNCITNNIILKNTVLDFVFNKAITGVRLEAAGRLTKRFTASRSLHKLKYKGSLENKDSSNNGLSSVLLTGNRRVNLQHTKISSVCKIGSFGVKGSISNTNRSFHSSSKLLKVYKNNHYISINIENDNLTKKVNIKDVDNNTDWAENLDGIDTIMEGYLVNVDPHTTNVPDWENNLENMNIIMDVNIVDVDSSTTSDKISVKDAYETDTSTTDSFNLDTSSNNVLKNVEKKENIKDFVSENIERVDDLKKIEAIENYISDKNKMLDSLENVNKTESTKDFVTNNIEPSDNSTNYSEGLSDFVNIESSSLSLLFSLGVIVYNSGFLSTIPPYIHNFNNLIIYPVITTTTELWSPEFINSIFNINNLFEDLSEDTAANIHQIPLIEQEFRELLMYLDNIDMNSFPTLAPFFTVLGSFEPHDITGQSNPIDPENSLANYTRIWQQLRNLMLQIDALNLIHYFSMRINDLLESYTSGEITTDNFYRQFLELSNQATWFNLRFEDDNLPDGVYEEYTNITSLLEDLYENRRTLLPSEVTMQLNDIVIQFLDLSDLIMNI